MSHRPRGCVFFFLNKRKRLSIEFPCLTKNVRNFCFFFFFKKSFFDFFSSCTTIAIRASVHQFESLHQPAAHSSAPLARACPQVNTRLRRKQKKLSDNGVFAFLTMIFFHALSHCHRGRRITLFRGHPDPSHVLDVLCPAVFLGWIHKSVSQSCIKFFRLVSLRWDILHTCSVTASTFLPVGSQVSVCRSKHCLSSSS